MIYFLIKIVSPIFVKDRMWRKTRSKAHEGSDECPGVDGNRNFDHYFGTSAASADPCSIIYEGPAPFSEPEIRVIRDVVLQNLDRAAMYISVHSFGNMFLYAWGNNGMQSEVSIYYLKISFITIFNKKQVNV